ncbi:MAG TPA: Hsp20/alpha crystallin family protein [Dehalococcoidia bacterium]|nr:Hsp20/alpha crystallin family protein [Dehalococcoidia bacterium]
MADKNDDKQNGKQLVVQRDTFGLADMREEMDRLWEVITGRARTFPQLHFQQVPAIDVFEKDGALHIRAELPGLTQKDIELEVSDNGLTISGERKEEKEVKEEMYSRSERTYGKFVRRIPLPRTADTDKADARFKDGVLEIDMPLTGAPSAKKIAVA